MFGAACIISLLGMLFGAAIYIGPLDAVHHELHKLNVGFAVPFGVVIFGPCCCIRDNHAACGWEHYAAGPWHAHHPRIAAVAMGIFFSSLLLFFLSWYKNPWRHRRNESTTQVAAGKTARWSIGIMRYLFLAAIVLALTIFVGSGCLHVVLSRIRATQEKQHAAELLNLAALEAARQKRNLLPLPAGYAPDLSRLDRQYYEYQEQFFRGPSLAECDDWLADTRFVEWHDDLLYRGAVLTLNVDPAGARQRLERIINEYPHEISEEEIKFFNAPSLRYSERELVYRRLHPTMTADRALYLLAHLELNGGGSQQKAEYWLQRLWKNDLGNPRYDDAVFNQTVESANRLERPYVLGAERLLGLYRRNYPDRYEELIRQLMLPGELQEVREIATLKLAERRFYSGRYAEAKALARQFLKQFPHSMYFDDARAIAENEDHQ